MTITLSDMEFHAYHGVLPQERVVGGKYSVDVKMETDDETAAETDRLADTIDYSEVYRVVKEEMALPSQLIEHVAGRIARRIRRDFPTIKCATVKVAKKHPPIPGTNLNASVEICF